MSKLNKLIQAVKILVQKPYMINKVIDNEYVHQDEVLKIGVQYKEGIPTIDLTEVLPNFNETINADGLDPYFNINWICLCLCCYGHTKKEF